MYIDKLLALAGEHSLSVFVAAGFLVTVIVNSKRIYESIDYRKSTKIRHLEKMLSLNALSPQIKALCENEMQYEIFRLAYKVKPSGDLIERVAVLYNSSKGSLKIETLVNAMPYFKERGETGLGVEITWFDNFGFVWNMIAAILCLLGFLISFVSPLIVKSTGGSFSLSVFLMSFFFVIVFVLLVWQSKDVASAKSVDKYLKRSSE